MRKRNPLIAHCRAQLDKLPDDVHDRRAVMPVQRRVKAIGERQGRRQIAIRPVAGPWSIWHRSEPCLRMR
jgi:hypothetical protein